MNEIMSRVPGPRTLVQPGPLNPVRIKSLHSAQARHVRLTLSPGRSLYDALVAPLARAGIENASTTLLGGDLEAVDYCVAPPDPSGTAVAAYITPIHADKAYLVFGNATLGKDASGEAVVHCHAAIMNANGEVRGGHILPHTCIIGRQPIVALVTALDGFELRVSYDAETNLSFFLPTGETSHA